MEGIGKTERWKLHYIILSGISFNFSCSTLSSFLLHLFSSEILLIFLGYNFSFLFPSTRVAKWNCLRFCCYGICFPFQPSISMRVRKKLDKKTKREKTRKVQDFSLLIFHLCGSRGTSDGKVKHKRKSRL